MLGQIIECDFILLGFRIPAHTIFQGVVSGRNKFLRLSNSKMFVRFGFDKVNCYHRFVEDHIAVMPGERWRENERFVFA